MRAYLAFARMAAPFRSGSAAALFSSDGVSRKHCRHRAPLRFLLCGIANRRTGKRSRKLLRFGGQVTDLVSYSSDAAPFAGQFWR